MQRKRGTQEKQYSNKATGSSKPCTRPQSCSVPCQAWVFMIKCHHTSPFTRCAGLRNILSVACSEAEDIHGRVPRNTTFPLMLIRPVSKVLENMLPLLRHLIRVSALPLTWRIVIVKVARVSGTGQLWDDGALHVPVI